MSHKLSNVVKVLLFLYLFSIGYAIFTERHFFADGAHYFRLILESKFFYAEGFSRSHANYITQFIPVILIKIFSVRNVDFLSYAFGFGLYAPQLISMLICYLLVRKNNIYFMLFPIISLFGLSLNVTFQIVSESLVISYVFWPIFFYVVLKENFNWIDTLMIFVLASVFSRSYESASILGSILIVFLVLIMFERWHKTTMLTKIVWFFLLVIFLVSVLIALYFIIFPLNPENRGHFLFALPSILRHYPALLSVIYILVISLCIFIPNFTKSFFYKYVILFLGIFTVFVSLIPILIPDLTRPDLHHNARVFMTYMLPLLSFVAYLVIRGIVIVPEFAWKKIIVLITFLVIGQTTWQILATSQWNGFRHIFKEELMRYNGIVSFEDTILKEKNVGIQLIRPMIWRWTNPTLSILWAKNLDVNTIITIPSDALKQWQPFDPSNANDLPKLEEFGFSFEKYKSFLLNGDDYGLKDE